MEVIKPNRTLYTELPGIYYSTREYPNVFRIQIRMRDLIDPEVLREAVDAAMERYPYFCVELRREESGEWSFTFNNRPVALLHSTAGAELNALESDFHLLSFSWHDDWITLDMSHALTDGKGAYELIRTLLHVYCSLRYHADLPRDGVRITGDRIREEEWADPLAAVEELPAVSLPVFAPPLDIRRELGLAEDRKKTVYSLAVPEPEFVRFNTRHDGSPATMISLLLSRALARLCPDSADTIRVGMYIDWRSALRAPLAHQCLVGTINLEYKKKMRSWPLHRQATAYRGMVFAQTQEEAILAEVAAEKAFIERIRAEKSDGERLKLAEGAVEAASRLYSLTVSYVGKADFKGAESYIRDFRTWTCSNTTPILVEISAVNDRFTLDFIQNFHSPVLVNALLAELQENGIRCELQDVRDLRLPGIRHPWLDDSGGR